VKVWIDLSNSPHPLLFAPVARRLSERGHSIEVTARDNAQTVELARERWPNVVVIGGESPRGRVGKAARLAHRSARLWAWARRTRPDVAVSHNSYSQIVAARLAGVRVVTAMDFEHQPANHLAFRLAHAILVPDAMPRDALTHFGVRNGKARAYPGLKEELYLGDFQPDTHVLERLEIEHRQGRVVVLVRTPPSRALYHRLDNPLFPAVLTALGRQDQVRIVALARHPEQRAELEALHLENVVVPDHAVDSRSLAYAADLVIGAGGTMTREAALMGVPTISIFAGRSPAVDRALETTGRLKRLGDPAQVPRVAPRPAPPERIEDLRARGERLVDVFVESIERTALAAAAN
jgi:predicted glycosyltransferase